MKLTLSYNEAQKVGQHIINMRPYIFENMRLRTDDSINYIGDIEIVFEEDISHLCTKCGEYLEECICDEEVGE